MKRAFEKVAPDYPEIEPWHVIVDNAAHQLVKRPEQFEVIVMTNMNGDILSDLTSGLIGGLGFALLGEENGWRRYGVEGGGSGWWSSENSMTSWLSRKWTSAQ